MSTERALVYNLSQSLAISRLELVPLLSHANGRSDILSKVNIQRGYLRPLIEMAVSYATCSVSFKAICTQLYGDMSHVNLYDLLNRLSVHYQDLRRQSIDRDTRDDEFKYTIFVTRLMLETISTYNTASSLATQTATGEFIWDLSAFETEQNYDYWYTSLGFIAHHSEYAHVSGLDNPYIVYNESYKNVLLLARAGFANDDVNELLIFLEKSCELAPQLYLIVDFLNRFYRIARTLEGSVTYDVLMGAVKLDNNVDTIYTRYKNLFAFSPDPTLSEAQNLEIQNEYILRMILDESLSFTNKKSKFSTVVGTATDATTALAPFILRPVAKKLGDIYKSVLCDSVDFTVTNFKVKKESDTEGIKLADFGRLRKDFTDLVTTVNLQMRLLSSI